jgi:hypothetical protein
MATFPSASASRTRSAADLADAGGGVLPSVMMAAWLPVKERASAPSCAMAMVSSAAAMRSPAVSSMSISLGCRLPARSSPVTCAASSVSSSVVCPMAETTTTRSSPRARARATRRATARIRSGEPTEVPPNFWTTRGMKGSA